MRKVAALVALALNAGAALAASAAEFKGLPMGASYADVEARFGKQERCPAAAAKGNFTCYMRVDGVTYANERLSGLSIKFRRGRMAAVNLSFSPSSFYSIVSALKEKYGSGHEATEQVQNEFGATFQQVRMNWELGDGATIRAVRYLDVETGYVAITSAEELRDQQEAIKAEGKPSADL